MKDYPSRNINKKERKNMTEVKKEVSKKTETVKKSFQLPELKDLLQAGAHFGHKKSAWNPRMKKYIYDERNGIHIIDLVKTLEKLEEALKKLSKASSKGNILIVGTKGQAATIVQKVATENGMFYINRRWPGGLFTNFDGIKRSVEGLIKMEEKLARGGEGLVKKEILLMKKDVERLNRMYQGIKFMDKLPEAIIVIDSKIEENAIKEAINMHIPIIALIDTNCNPDLIDYPVPANDDSLKSIDLFVGLFGKVVAESQKALSVISLRRNHIATLERLSREYEEERERQIQMENEERERMRALRDGKIKESVQGSLIRVVKKEKDIDADIIAAEAVKEKEDSKSVEELGLSARIVKSLVDSGIVNVGMLKTLSKDELADIKGIGAKAVEDILKAIK